MKTQAQLMQESLGGSDTLVGEADKKLSHIKFTGSAMAADLVKQAKEMGLTYSEFEGFIKRRVMDTQPEKAKKALEMAKKELPESKASSVYETITKQRDRDALEELIDKSGLSEVVETLSEIAYEKAEHLRSNWQDEEAAKDWEKDGKALDTVTAKLNN